MKTFVCPYCFTKHPLEKIQFRCSCNGCKKTVDAELSRYYGVQRMSNVIFSAPKASGRRAACPECHEITKTRVCPSCHNELPSGIDEGREIIISLVGTRDSGKSSYVTVLIYELIKHLAGRLNGTARFMTNTDREQYKDRFGRFIYPAEFNDRRMTGGSRIPQTMTRRGTAIGQNRPILCKITFERKKLFGTENVDYTFVFFDAAGEDFEDEETMNVVANYIAHSDGIIFLIDPLTNAYARSQLSDEEVSGASTIEAGTVSSPKEVIDRVAELVRLRGGLADNAKIQIPVAAAFSKLDVLNRIIPRGSTLSQPSPHALRGRFDEQDMKNIDSEMRGLLAAWDAQDFLDSLRFNYTNARIFAFSALGDNPRQDGTLAKPKPHRIEDALLWILHEMKVLP